MGVKVEGSIRHPTLCQVAFVGDGLECLLVLRPLLSVPFCVHTWCRSLHWDVLWLVLSPQYWYSQRGAPLALRYSEQIPLFILEQVVDLPGR